MGTSMARNTGDLADKSALRSPRDHEIDRVGRHALAALLTIFLLIARPVMAATRVTIPGGTPVAVSLVQKLDSGTAKVGDIFNFAVDADVTANGWIVIPKGAGGQGEVVSVDRAGGNGHSGSLGLKFDFVYAVDGEKVRLSNASGNVRGEQKTGAASTATIVGYATLGLGGLFFHNWVKGRNVVLAPSKTFTAFVSRTVHVMAMQRAPSSQYVH